MGGQFNFEVCSIHPFLCICGEELYNFMEQLKASDKIRYMSCFKFEKKYTKNHKHWAEYFAESTLQGAGLLSLGYRNAAQSNC